MLCKHGIKVKGMYYHRRVAEATTLLAEEFLVSKSHSVVGDAELTALAVAAASYPAYPAPNDTEQPQFSTLSPVKISIIIIL
jgi:hypothetical protein